jgi:hypothetical protein
VFQALNKGGGGHSEVGRSTLTHAFIGDRAFGKATDVAIRCGWIKWVAKIETDVESVADAVSVCSDSNYNLSAISFIRRTQNRRQNNARLIDDEHREHSIIYLFKI